MIAKILIFALVVVSIDATLSEAICEYRSLTKTVYCNGTSGSAECNATMEGSALIFKHYAISEVHVLTSHVETKWFHLFPRKLNNEGWWFYKGVNSDKTSPHKLLLHSSDRHNSEIEGFDVSSLTCWAQLHSIIESSSKIETIEVDKHVKLLGGTHLEEHKVIGYLTVV